MVKSETSRDPFLLPLWSITLVVYVLLLCITGFLAFLLEMPKNVGGGGQYNPAHAPIEFLDRAAQNQETQRFVLETLRADSDSFQKKRNLASQSFNVVLGALLGFLSASATFSFGQRGRSKDQQPIPGEKSPTNKPANGTGG